MNDPNVAELCEATGELVLEIAEVLSRIPPRYLRGTETLLGHVARIERASVAILQAEDSADATH